MEGCCEHSLEFSGPIKGGYYLQQLSNYQLLKEYRNYEYIV